MGASGKPAPHWFSTVRFPYAPYDVEPTPTEPGVSVIHRPVIPFRAYGPNGAFVFYGLLDTGADETILPEAMADRLGLVPDFSQILPSVGAGGEVAVAYVDLTLEVGRGKERYGWSTSIGVVKQPWQEAILGRRGFLKFFDVIFHGGKHVVVLKRNRIPFQ